MALTLTRLKSLIKYDPQSGRFVRVRGVRGHAKGENAGTYTKNRCASIVVDQRRYKAHRIAWFYMTGHWPKSQIDHRDRNEHNNKWKNLREATPSQNGANSAPRGAISGRKGVHWCADTGKWRAKIKVRGKHIHLGRFKSIAIASDAYAKAARKHFGSFSRP